MKKRFFLGTGAGFNAEMRERMRSEEGTHQDYLNLCQYIKETYKLEQVLITRNGRSAIAAGLDFGLKEKGEVIINGFTCYAVVQGVKASGMKPVYADIDKKTLNFTLETIKKVTTKKTVAIIVQNTLGNMVEIRKVEDFCKKNGLVLIEDLAHSAGRCYPDGREAGTVGDIVVWSFGKEKSIDTVNGGAVGFRNINLAPVLQPSLPSLPKEEERARMYPTYGARCRVLSRFRLSGLYMHLLLKFGRVVKSADADVDYKKHRLSDWQAKLALEQLKNIKNRGKRPLREFFLVKDREVALNELKKAGYFFDGFWYEKPVSPARYYEKVHFDEKSCPVAVEVSQKIINFPDYYTKNELTKAYKIVGRYLDE